MKAGPRKMKMRISGSHVLTFSHNIVYTFLFLYVSLSGIPLFIQRTVAWDKLLVLREGGGVSTNFYTGRLHPEGPTPYPLIRHFSRKRYPFCIPYIDDSYPFHIPCLELCIPFNLFNRNAQKNRAFSRLFKALKFICSPFRVFHGPK